MLPDFYCPKCGSKLLIGSTTNISNGDTVVTVGCSHCKKDIESESEMLHDKTYKDALMMIPVFYKNCIESMLFEEKRKLWETVKEE